jgi:hypothetical protein
MKRIGFLSLMGILAIAGCGPVTNRPVQTPLRPATRTAVPAGPTARRSQTAPPPPSTQPATPSVTGMAWDTSPAAKMFVATLCCGLAPDLLKINYLPAALVWGDGYILWTKMDSDGHRQVLEGKLSQDQMFALVQGALDQGFFDWNELYKSPNSPTDLPPKCISFQLKDRSHRVCEYFKGAPAEFTDLYNTLASGAGLEGKDYRPSKGFLVSHPQDPSYKPASTSQSLVWNAKSTNLSLSQAINGVWIEGPALEAAWDLVQSRPAGPMIKDDGTYYQLSLQIPGVSMIEPPAS